MIPILSALVLSAAPAPATQPSADASPASMAPAFANTIVSTYPDGLHGRLWLHEDGTWRALSRHGSRSSGRWSLKGERVCLKQSRPIPIFFSYCTPAVRGEVGTSWAAKAPTGEPITVRLEPGRAGEPE